MGSAFARVLMAGGHNVTVWNRTAERCAPLVALGAVQASTVGEAIAASDLVLPIVLDQEAVRELFEDQDLAGKTIVNYTTGTAAEAVAQQRLTTTRGARYSDAVIAAYPDDIGKRDALIYYAGDESVHGQFIDIFTELSGRAEFVGTEPGNANVLDAAWVGGFHCVAIGGFHEAVAFAMAQGVSIDTMADSVDYYVEFLRGVLKESVKAIGASDFTTDQATLDVYLSGIRSCRQSMIDAGQRAGLISANLHSLEIASAAGHGSDSLYAQVLTMRA
jgi:3-hydroxyisobutyrate dehydrogenase-like beta-hydroxyacid dehydrogenase